MKCAKSGGVHARQESADARGEAEAASPPGVGGSLGRGSDLADSEGTDKGKKFDAVIRKSDIVLLLKNFISHDLFYHAKDLMCETGGHFIVLRSGYGTRQVVSQIAQYVTRASGNSSKH